MASSESDQQVFKRMARKSCWTIEEGILLILEINGCRAAALETLQRQISNPPFHQINPHVFGPEFVDMHQTAMRAVYTGHLQKLSSPKKFLAWAQKMDYSIPADLLEAVNKIWSEQSDEGKKSDEKNTMPQIQTDKLDGRTEKSYKHIIGALLAVIEGRDGFNKHPDIKKRTDLVEKLEEKYSGYRGVSKTNLFTIFPEAEKLIENLNLEDS